MSHITVTMMMVDIEDNATVYQLNQWLREEGGGWLNHLGDDPPRKFTYEQDVVWGGYKGAHADVWGGGLNNVHREKVLAHIAHTPWLHPNCVQVLMQSEGQGYFRLWMIRDGELRLYTPTEPDDSTNSFWGQRG